jgi:hypothetical protein
MRFPQFSDQEISINGSGYGDDRQLRFTGTISSSAPFVILSLLKFGDAFHYTKHNKSNALEVPLNLHQGKFPHQNRYQHTLVIGHSVNTGVVSEGRLFLADELPMTLGTGERFAFGTDTQNEQFIYLMAIAKVDFEIKRNWIGGELNLIFKVILKECQLKLFQSYHSPPLCT